MILDGLVVFVSPSWRAMLRQDPHWVEQVQTGQQPWEAGLLTSVAHPPNLANDGRDFQVTFDQMVEVALDQDFEF